MVGFAGSIGRLDMKPHNSVLDRPGREFVSGLLIERATVNTAVEPGSTSRISGVTRSSIVPRTLLGRVPRGTDVTGRRHTSSPSQRFERSTWSYDSHGT